MSTHPVALVPEKLFDDPAAERRWRARFSAPRISLPEWAVDAPDRCVYQSNSSGTWEIYAWDRATGTHRQVTDRPSGTYSATLSPDGEHLWWFADTDGDEFGQWVREPFGGSPDPATLAVGAPADGSELDGYQAGLEIGRNLVALGTATDEGSRIWLARRDQPATLLYASADDAGVGALSEDETLLAISHSEHGDSRHPAIRVLRAGPEDTGTVVAELHDGPGKGLMALSFPEIKGDTRLLVGHERHGRDELLIWDVATGKQTELNIELPGELVADFYPDGTALLLLHTHAARTELYRYELASGRLTRLDTAPGCIGNSGVRPDGTIEYSCSSAAVPTSVRALHPDGTDRELLTPPGDPAPPSVPVRDAWISPVSAEWSQETTPHSRGAGRIHALVAVPEGVQGPLPAVFALHGGPHAADEDRYSPVRAAWVDAGFAVIEVNYRGSTGYGSAWRDAIEGNPGHTELADVAAVHDWAVDSGLVDPARCVVEGWSWGGYLALLALGTQPDRWVAGIAGVPVADYLSAYADEMEQLRSFDRALFGGSPQELPEQYRNASPLTYVDRVRAPVLVLAGENDPRCPIRQVDNYLDALAELPGSRYAVDRFDAGHGSLVVEQSIRHQATEIAFARAALANAENPT